MELDNDGRPSYCAINQGLDGAYYITVSARDAVIVRKFKRLSPSWKRRLRLLMNSILADTPSKPNVILFPTRRAP